MPAKTRLAQLVAKEEGFGKPNTIPTLRHNPGDLRHSPHSSHIGLNPEAIGNIDTDADGWLDLERQLMILAGRGLILAAALEIYAPANENDTTRYINDVARELGVSPETPLRDALKVPAVSSPAGRTV